MGLTRKQIILVVLVVVGAFVAILNQTLVTPVIPTIMVEMSVDATTVTWLTTGFTLMNVIMIPITAFLTDRFSVRGLYATSMAIFAGGSVLAGLAPQFATLLAGRLVQAAGAGIMTPLAMTVLLRTFPVERRGIAMGLYSLVVAFGPAIGPTVAGAFVDSIGWRVLFYVIAVFAVLICIGTLIFIEKGGSARKDVKLDVLSVVLSSIGFGAFLYGLSVIGSDGIGLAATIGLVVGAVVLVLFFYRQLAMDMPMLQVRVLANRNFLISTIAIMVVQMSLMGGSVLVPIYVQNDLGLSALQSGLVVMPGAILNGVMSPVSGRLFDRYGPRALSIIGMALTAAGSALFMLANDSTTLIYLMACYAVRMFGMSLINTPVQTWGMNALPDELINHGTSVINTFRQVASAFGTAILVSVYSLTMASSMDSMGEIEASIHGFNIAFAVAASLAVAALIVTIIFVRNDPSEHDDTPEAATQQDTPLESDADEKGTANLEDAAANVAADAADPTSPEGAAANATADVS